MGKFLERVGRRKLIIPIYKALVATPDGLAFAEQVFAKAKPGTHPITAGTIEQVIAEGKAKLGDAPAPAAPADAKPEGGASAPQADPAAAH